ncbi:TorF family putative porin [candidate division KSB1 bacterium]
MYVIEKFRLIKLYIVFFSLITGPCVGIAQIRLTEEVSFASKYIWRGYNIADTPVMQPSVTLEEETTGLSVNIWGSAALTDRGEFDTADELDFTLTYSTSFVENVECTAGSIFYTFPTQYPFDFDNHTTFELFFTASPSNLPVNTELTVYYDFNLGDDLYASIKLNDNVPLSGLSVGYSVGIGYNNGQFGSERGISDIVVAVDSAFLLKNLTIAPGFQCILTPEDSVNPDNEIVLSVSIGR